MNGNEASRPAGVHSIGEFSLTVPSLDVARRFYSAFGLDVRDEGGALAIHAADGVRWGGIAEGPRKRLEHLSLNCFDADFRVLKTQILDSGHVLTDRANVSGASARPESLWLRDPDGLLIELRAGPKTMPDAMSSAPRPEPVAGVRQARHRRAVSVVRPRRLSHIALLTSDVGRKVDFYAEVFGLKLSDRSGDDVAFLHGRHGSDHHLVAFARSTGSALHHLSWDVPSVDDVGLGAAQMAASGYAKGWGVGRHVLGSNYFYYVEDPWGSFCEYSSGMDFIPATVDWPAMDHEAHDSFYLWGPDVPTQMLVNSEAVDASADESSRGPTAA